MHCGTQVKRDLPISGQEEENKEHVYCPYCLSENITYGKEGFSAGQALTGAVLTGGIGLLAGFIGSKDVRLTCLKCGKRFELKEAFVATPSDKEDYKNELEDAIHNYGIYSKQTIDTVRRKFPESALSTYTEIAQCYKEAHNITLSPKAKEAENSLNLQTIGCLCLIILFFILCYALG